MASLVPGCVFSWTWPIDWISPFLAVCTMITNRIKGYFLTSLQQPVKVIYLRVVVSETRGEWLGSILLPQRDIFPPCSLFLFNFCKADVTRGKGMREKKAKLKFTAVTTINYRTFHGIPASLGLLQNIAYSTIAPVGWRCWRSAALRNGGIQGLDDLDKTGDVFTQPLSSSAVLVLFISPS